jgi:glucose-6-phosphate isomerase
MVKFYSVGRQFDDLDWSIVDQKAKDVAKMIADENGEGADFLGWENYASTLPEGEIKKIEEDAKKIRANYEALVVVGIGGSYLGARAVIDAINGLFPEDKFEIIYLGNTLSASYTYQVMRPSGKEAFCHQCHLQVGNHHRTECGFPSFKGHDGEGIRPCLSQGCHLCHDR